MTLTSKCWSMLAGKILIDTNDAILTQLMLYWHNWGYTETTDAILTQLTQLMLYTDTTDTTDAILTQLMLYWHNWCYILTQLTQLMLYWHNWCYTDTTDAILIQLMLYWHNWCYTDTTDTTDAILTQLMLYWHNWCYTDTTDAILTQLMLYWHYTDAILTPCTQASLTHTMLSEVMALMSAVIGGATERRVCRARILPVIKQCLFCGEGVRVWSVSACVRVCVCVRVCEVWVCVCVSVCVCEWGCVKCEGAWSVRVCEWGCVCEGLGAGHQTITKHMTFQCSVLSFLKMGWGTNTNLAVWWEDWVDFVELKATLSASEVNETRVPTQSGLSETSGSFNILYMHVHMQSNILVHACTLAVKHNGTCIQYMHVHREPKTFYSTKLGNPKSLGGGLLWQLLCNSLLYS